MADIAGAFGASKSASTLLVLFIPSRDRNDRAIGFPLEDKPPSRRQSRIIDTNPGRTTECYVHR